MPVIALRLKPGDDLKVALQSLCERRNLTAACIVTCVGSLDGACLRFSNQPQGTVLPGKWEIVSLTGTLSVHGSHLHMALSDGHGHTVGGHVMPGCRIYTTAELVVGVLPTLEFHRQLDPVTTFRELTITPAPNR